MSGALYALADALLFRPLGPDRGHALALRALGLGLGPRSAAPHDPFEWRGIRFENRVGVAAGFDKNALAVAGIARLGASFVEVGTILTRPWSGSALRPRMLRLGETGGVWNRLGFPSDGVARVAARLAATRASGCVVACNIAPHPETLEGAAEPGFAARVREELALLVDALHLHARFFVVNLSSPNTAGLRSVLHGEGFAEEVVAPTRARLASLAAASGTATRPLLVKLPPEDASAAQWTPDTLAKLVAPLARPEVCDGFVAVNSSIRLARELSPAARPDAPGGVSGAPLLPLALAAQRALRELAHPSQLRIGVGGICAPEDARALVAAGAQLVEIYSGMISRGPGLVSDCARALADGG